MENNNSVQDANKLLRLVRQRLMACMETGNISEARTTIREYAATNPKEAAALRADIVAAYNKFL